MTTLTSAELGSIGYYIDLGSPAALDNLGSMTILAYSRPTGSGGGGFGYWYGKTPSGTTAGHRFFTIHNAAAPQFEFGSHSTGSASNPQRAGPNNSITYNSWQHNACVWDGSITAANCALYTGVGANLAEVGSYSLTTNGATAIYDDSAENVFLMNRRGLGREFVGDIAYIAIWDRALSLSELIEAQNNGPLNVPTGLVLLWANQQDLGPNALTPAARATFVAGSLPPNTNLGGTADGSASGATLTGTGSVSAGAAAADSAAAGAALTGTGSVTAGSATGSGDGSASGATLIGTGSVSAGAAAADSAAAGATLTGTGAISAGTASGAEPMVVDDSFERSSINVAGSSVTGIGDDAVVTLKPRVQESEVVSSETRWLFPFARVANVNGFRPTFRFIDYGSGAGKYHGYPWQSGRRPMFSYNPFAASPVWTHFDTAVTVGAADITFRHSTAFTQSPVYVSWGRTWTVTQTATWIAALASSYPNLVHETPSSSNFIAGTFAAQTDELSRAIAAQPFHACKISDANLTPADGNPKRAMVLTSGVHAGEDQGSWALKAAVEFLLGAASQAQNVRQHFDIYVYPLINAPGRTGGGWRGSFTQGTGGIDDANRHYSDASPGLEIITLPRGVMQADLPAVVQVILDFHGAYTISRGLYNDGAYQTAFDTALETYVGAGNVSNEGASNAGFLAKWFNNSRGATYYITVETGEPTPLSDADLIAWGEAQIKAVSDRLNAGDIPAATAAGEILTGTGSVAAGAAAANSAAPGATLTGTGQVSAGPATGGGSGDGQASGVTLTGPGSVSAGAASGNANGTAPGATLTGTSSLIAGTAYAPSEASYEQIIAVRARKLTLTVTRTHS